MPEWLTALSWGSCILGIATASAIVMDLSTRPQRMAIMNIVWPITGIYFPLIGWWVYRRLGQPTASDAARKHQGPPMWKSVFVSATHCGSGCVIGDIIGAPIVLATGWTVFGERLYADYAAKFALAYLFGIAFQYFPIRAMRDTSRREALLAAVKADSLSIIAFEIGMFAWMAAVNFFFFPRAPPGPLDIVYWFMMQIAMILGFVTTYPANWLLVRTGVKTGM